ncbi:MAG: response regulator transcription factor [Acidobacteriia bacterium]|nr:response regulator transcription factor [Terriglobia bacterium]
MRILIAEDDAVSRRRLEATLQKWGYEVLAVEDGLAAWEVLQGEMPPPLAILDWMMPGMDGIEVCRKVRERSPSRPLYIIVLTARGSREDVVAGLQAGGDDYVTKPFDREELHARVRVGLRVLQLQMNLADRVRELEEALARVKQLQGLLPICSYCKKIRDDQNYWQQVEGYISEHSEAIFSHGICPDCFEKFVKPELNKLKSAGEKS